MALNTQLAFGLAARSIDLMFINRARVKAEISIDGKNTTLEGVIESFNGKNNTLNLKLSYGTIKFTDLQYLVGITPLDKESKKASKVETLPQEKVKLILANCEYDKTKLTVQLKNDTESMDNFNGTLKSYNPGKQELSLAISGSCVLTITDFSAIESIDVVKSKKTTEATPRRPTLDSDRRL